MKRLTSCTVYSAHGQTCLPCDAVNGAFGVLPPYHILTCNLITVMNLSVWIPLLEDCRSYTKAATLATAAFHTQDGISAKKLKIFWEEVCPPLSVVLGTIFTSAFLRVSRGVPYGEPLACHLSLVTGFKDNWLKYHPYPEDYELLVYKYSVFKYSLCLAAI